uniref:Aldose 1-epimerase n=1 Tax=Davidia involucrata TaxID=16924 RepID=A0A5B7CG88_DAVIN
MLKISLLFCFIIVAFGVVVNGSVSKKETGFYELKKGNFSVKLTNWGATIVSVVLPDKNGKLGDVVLGYDSIKDYMNDSTYFGAVVGRVANRIGKAQFTLNGTRYKLDANEGKNMLHGGSKGFSDVVWKVRKHEKESQSPHITFTYRSSDGEEGFPGDLLATVTYVLVGHNEMSVTMKAKALNKATPVNLAQHSYWNLGGHDSGSILSNEIQIFGSHITPVNKKLIPSGKLSSVKGTPFDFLKPHTIKSKINGLPDGYDINYALDGHESHNKLKPAAIVKDNKSGRVMELFTNAPGLQFYTGNYIKDLKGKGGYVYKAHAGLCLETQGFPDSVNHPNFPSQIVTPGKPYKHNMLFKFSTKAAA